MAETQNFDWDGAEALARAVLQIRAVELRPEEPFTWSSGWKSPIYCDYRSILGFPMVWDLVVDGFKEAVKMVAPGVEVLAGTATAGIPHAAAVARELRLPMAYVRSSAKAHGKGKQVEGRSGARLKTVVIEDTLSTGQSAYDAVKALQAEGMEVQAVLAIYSYDFEETVKRARESGVPAVRLLGYDTLVEVAQRLGYVEKKDATALSAWRAHPDRYGDM